MAGNVIGDVLRGKHRILLLGSCGSGKTYLAKRLAAETGLPLVHLDDVYWGPRWARSAPEVFRENVRALARGERWIIDGNYASTIPERLERAELVVWLDFSTLRCLCSVLWRDVRRAMGERESLPAAVRAAAERPPTTSGRRAFYKHVLGFRRNVRPIIERELRGARVPVVRLTSRREVSRLVHR